MIGRMSLTPTVPPMSSATGGRMRDREARRRTPCLASARTRAPSPDGMAMSSARWRRCRWPRGARASTPPRDGHALDGEVALPGVVVEEGDGDVGAVGAGEQRADRLGAGVAGADHDGGDRPLAGTAPVVVGEAPGVADGAGADQRHDGREDHDRERHDVPDEVGHEQGEGRHGAGADEPPDLLEGAELEAADVDAGGAAGDQLHGGQDGEHGERRGTRRGTGRRTRSGAPRPERMARHHSRASTTGHPGEPVHDERLPSGTRSFGSRHHTLRINPATERGLREDIGGSWGFPRTVRPIPPVSEQLEVPHRPRRTSRPRAPRWRARGARRAWGPGRAAGRRRRGSCRPPAGRSRHRWPTPRRRRSAAAGGRVGSGHEQVPDRRLEGVAAPAQAEAGRTLAPGRAPGSGRGSRGGPSG